jgi:hypothetical protein
LVNQIRVGLKRAEADIETSQAAKHIVRILSVKFEDEFGTGNPGSVFDDHLHEGPSRRLIGLQLKTMMACALDPRTKTLVGNTLRSLFRYIIILV